jgi:hypothetical protein
MKMRIFPLFPLIVAAMFLMGIRQAFAWNPIADVRDNLLWTFGKTAEAGIAVKLAGAGDLQPGDTATSALAGIADYRFLTFSYGGIVVNRADAKPTDTFKIGFRLTSFFDLFKNPPTPQMTFLRDVNVGPAISSPIISRTHPVTLFLEANYQFGGSPTVTP